MMDRGFVMNVSAFGAAPDPREGDPSRQKDVEGEPHAAIGGLQIPPGDMVVSAGRFFDGPEESASARGGAQPVVPDSQAVSTPSSQTNPYTSRFFGPSGFDLTAYDKCLPPAVGKLFAYGDGYTANPLAATIRDKTRSMEQNLAISVGGLIVMGLVAGAALWAGQPEISLVCSLIGGVISMGTLCYNFFYKESMKLDLPAGINELFDLFLKRGCPENKARYLGRLIDLLQSVPLFAGNESITVFGSHPGSNRSNVVAQVSVAAGEVISDVWEAHNRCRQPKPNDNYNQMNIEALEKNIEERVGNQLTRQFFEKVTENVMIRPNLLWDLSVQTAIGGAGLNFFVTLASGLL